MGSVVGKRGNCHLSANWPLGMLMLAGLMATQWMASSPASAEARESVPKSRSTPVASKPLAAKSLNQSQRPQTPLMLLVSLRKQRVRVFDGSGELASSRISSGQPGFDTPTGIFSILEKREYHESNIYDGAPMPHMQRVTWSGIAFHAGIVPGYRASHGCIRLPASFARSLFKQTSVGARVVITQDELVPINFEDDLLLRPLPAVTVEPGQSASMRDTRVAANSVPGAGDVE